jgi:hypothetical protein
MKTGELVARSWSDLWAYPRTRGMIIFCGLALLLVFFYLPVFYQEVIGPRPGIFPDDPVLRHLVPLDWSVFTFTIIYLSIAETFFSIIRQPYRVLLGLSVYLLVTLLRMIAMYGLTFEPPPDMIPLIDPVTAHFYPQGGFSKDLFFSGHVSTMTLMVMLENRFIFKLLKGVGTLAVAVFLAWQHVHYTLDLLVAPLVTILVYRILRQFLSPVLADQQRPGGRTIP